MDRANANRSPDRAAAASSSSSATLLLYFAFLTTGLGLVLPGSLLPFLLTRWSMGDARGGSLFFVFSAGSMLGALLARGSLRYAISLGCAAAALGAAALAAAGAATALVSIALFGCGLGVMMTAITLHESRRHPQDRVAHLSRLNLVWACGASLGPLLELNSAAHFGLQPSLRVAAWCFLFLGAAIFVALRGTGLNTDPTSTPARPEAEPSEEQPVAGTGMSARSLGRRALWLLLLMVPLATGIESAVGGWLATYSRRSGEALGGIVAATTCFWLGILISRLLLSDLRLAAKLARVTIWACPGVVVAALAALLLLGSHASTLMAASLLLGVGCGPLYPLLIARVLQYGEGGNVIFVVAGIGSSTLPLFTGLLSGWSHSLRVGLNVPLAAAALLAVCGVLLARTSAQATA